jgi:hypothetical protein
MLKLMRDDLRQLIDHSGHTEMPATPGAWAARCATASRGCSMRWTSAPTG